MYRLMCIAVLLAILAFVRPGHGSPVQKISLRSGKLEPYKSYVETLQCKGRERTQAIALGRDGRTYLALYAFDADGNCLDLDDEAVPNAKDDAAIEWYAAHNGLYTIEVRNLGPNQSVFYIAVR
jgi:hypothetical protein